MRVVKAVILSFLVCFAGLVARGAESAALSEINCNVASVVAGNSLRCTATLSRPAPFEIAVSLAADPVDGARLPASVTVPAGAVSAAFTISTPMGKTAVGGSDSAVTIYGNYGVTRKASFTILAPVSFDEMVDRVVEREHVFVANMRRMHPLIETYIQNLRENRNENVMPVSDRYFLGRFDFNKKVGDQLFENEQPGFRHQLLAPFRAAFSRQFSPQGFAQMVMLDANFQKSNYYFNFVRQEFLGEVRCIVVDVQPKEHAPRGLFTGRIWVEDRDFNIVRFNGTYTPHSRYSYYLHFDSWRLNLQPGMWLPAYIYSEETDHHRSSPPYGSLYFKAQTRLWGYDVEHLKHGQEFTQVQVDAARDQSDSSSDIGPVEAQRMWQRQAEDNALDHLQNIGLLAPAGEVDRVLQTVVNNLIITNKLEVVPEVRCRVLLTSPLESFTIGHTIVVSRGLLDVLPDEASLAMILAHELSHIALGHRMDTQFAFNDRFFFPDQNTFQRVDFSRNKGDEEAADAKAEQLLANSPYKDRLATAGLFLKSLQARAQDLPNLIRPHLGNSLEHGKTVRMASLARSAPQLEPQRIDQIAALPLGARIKLDPWSNQLQMMHAKPITLLSAQEKMPFEVTPFFPYLTRLSSPVQGETVAAK
ncbi:MAG TPA: M48 family metalloprotease [Terriglobales bacterium]|nr:M48 family metalloprotease [Terriglobales bacterium]